MIERLAFAAWGLLMMALLAGGYSLFDRPIAKVSVGGMLSPAEREQIRAAVSQDLTGGARARLLGINLQSVVASVHALSWPRTVTVRRQWPDELVIDVVKHAAVARWAGGGYVSTSGEIVVLADGVDNLPVFDCSNASPAVAMEMYLNLSEVLAPLDLSIAQITENRVGEWSVAAGGITVMLGRADARLRLRRFVRVHERVQLDGGVIAYADARYRNGVAVRLQQRAVLNVVQAEDIIRGPEHDG